MAARRADRLDDRGAFGRFVGGAAGKLVCGLLADRIGVIRTVVITEAATALGIIAVVAALVPLGSLAAGAVALVLSLLYWLAEGLRIYDHDLGATAPPLPSGERNESCFSAVMPVSGWNQCV